MKVFHFNTKEEKELKALYEIQNASRRKLGKNLTLCYNLDACLESMNREGLVTLFNDEDENVMFHEEMVFLILNHQMIIYMTEIEFNELLSEL